MICDPSGIGDLFPLLFTPARQPYRVSPVDSVMKNISVGIALQGARLLGYLLSNEWEIPVSIGMMFSDSVIEDLLWLAKDEAVELPVSIALAGDSNQGQRLGKFAFRKRNRLHATLPALYKVLSLHEKYNNPTQDSGATSSSTSSTTSSTSTSDTSDEASEESASEKTSDDSSKASKSKKKKKKKKIQRKRAEQLYYAVI
eukprot:TRINITY_DN20727_c0_g1_i1.p1 TRINITY_DN20727_c0_g1~~TRINITY_DN20727_c0_g1_i1.p1  ORF type:complete len:207 (+),score=20.05 TRINITY_DN20727_c0_g1_i1:24-623(+)